MHRNVLSEATPQTAGVMTTAADFVRQFGQWSRLASAHPVQVTHHGRPTHVMTSIDDYRSLRAQAGRSADRETVDQLADWIDQGLIVCDAAYRVTLANRAALAMCRRREGALRGREIWQAFPELSDSLLGAHIRRAAQAGEGCAADLPSVFREGSWLRTQVHPFDDGVAILLRDVTHEVRERQLADARAAFMRAIDRHGDVGHLRISPRAHIEQVDSAVCALVRLPAERLVGVAVADLVVRRKRVEFRERLEAGLRKGTLCLETDLLANDGAEVPVRASLADIRGALGSEGAVMVMTRRAAAPSATAG